MTRDPIGYEDGADLYAAYFVPVDVDPYGLGIWDGVKGIGKSILSCQGSWGSRLRLTTPLSIKLDRFSYVIGYYQNTDFIGTEVGGWMAAYAYRFTLGITATIGGTVECHCCDREFNVPIEIDVRGKYTKTEYGKVVNWPIVGGQVSVIRHIKKAVRAARMATSVKPVVMSKINAHAGALGAGPDAICMFAYFSSDIFSDLTFSFEITKDNRPVDYSYYNFDEDEWVDFPLDDLRNK